MKNKKIKFIDEDAVGIKYSDIVEDFDELSAEGWFVLVRRCDTCKDLYLDKFCCMTCLEVSLNCLDNECDDCSLESSKINE